MADNWLDDGSGTISGEGDVVKCNAQPEGDAVFHALWKGDGPISSGTHYWEVEDKGGLNAVGLTTLGKFGKGYACKSFNFNSINLSNGGALLVSGYGPGHFKAGDKIGMLSELTDASLTITFYVNGRCLGPAFQMSSPYPTELYPVITFRDGGSSAAIKKIDEIPAARNRENETHPFPQGHWKAVGTSSPVTLDIFQKDDGLHGSLHVVNRCFLTLTPPGDQWSATVGGMTRMMGMPDQMALEHEYVQKLGALTNLTENDGNLVISTPSGDLTFEAAIPKLDAPYTANPLE